MTVMFKRLNLLQFSAAYRIYTAAYIEYKSVHYLYKYFFKRLKLEIANGDLVQYFRMQ